MVKPKTLLSFTMSEEYESDQEDVPYVELELDIEDCRQIFTSTKYRLEHWHFEDESEKERLTALNDFFYRVILEYNFKIDGED
jgi:hypothetical protein